MESLPLYNRVDTDRIREEVENGSSFLELASYFNLPDRVYKQMGFYLEMNVNGRLSISSDRDIAELFGTEEKVVRKYLDENLDKDGLVRRGEILKSATKRASKVLAGSR